MIWVVDRLDSQSAESLYWTIPRGGGRWEINLDSEVVDTPEEVGTSTYLVSKDDVRHIVYAAVRGRIGARYTSVLRRGRDDHGVFIRT